MRYRVKYGRKNTEGYRTKHRRNIKIKRRRQNEKVKRKTEREKEIEGWREGDKAIERKRQKEREKVIQ